MADTQRLRELENRHDTGVAASALKAADVLLAEA